MSSLLPNSLKDVSTVVTVVDSVPTDKPKTPSEAFISALNEMVKQKPQSAAEAAALYAYILQKEVYPLLNQLKNLFVAELGEAERGASATFLAEGNKLQEALVSKVRGCLPFLNR
jgi:hypothetical protein